MGRSYQKKGGNLVRTRDIGIRFIQKGSQLTARRMQEVETHKGQEDLELGGEHTQNQKPAESKGAF